MIAEYYKKTLRFKHAVGTSRGILTEKPSWFITLNEGGITGIGECSIIPGLSPDFKNEQAYQEKVEETVAKINSGELSLVNAPALLIDFPSILLGVETAFLDLQNGGNRIVFHNDFSKGASAIAINGLIWMGSEAFMLQQIEQKLKEGFSTLKMKIGAIDFDTEYTLLKNIRSEFNASEISLRVDANGAFDTTTVFKILQKLADLDIHSIEQPIKAGQWQAMKQLCSNSPIPIALDEELIGSTTSSEKLKLLEIIQPHYIVLKPSLHGGFWGCREWIQLAEDQQIAWWITSALESPIGLNAICQFTAEYVNKLPQGLGTGSLYMDSGDNNLVVEKGFIFQKEFFNRKFK